MDGHEQFPPHPTRQDSEPRANKRTRCVMGPRRTCWANHYASELVNSGKWYGLRAFVWTILSCCFSIEIRSVFTPVLQKPCVLCGLRAYRPTVGRYAGLVKTPNRVLTLQLRAIWAVQAILLAQSCRFPDQIPFGFHRRVAKVLCSMRFEWGLCHSDTIFFLLKTSNRPPSSRGKFEGINLCQSAMRKGMKIHRTPFSIDQGFNARSRKSGQGRGNQLAGSFTSLRPSTAHTFSKFLRLKPCLSPLTNLESTG